MPATLAEPVLTLAINNLEKSIHSASDIYTVWTVFTKCKDNLQNGRRLENMSWRLWYRSASLSMKNSGGDLAMPVTDEFPSKKEMMSAMFGQPVDMSRTFSHPDEPRHVNVIKKMVVQPCSIDEDDPFEKMPKKSTLSTVSEVQPPVTLLQNPFAVHRVEPQPQFSAEFQHHVSQRIEQLEAARVQQHIPSDDSGFSVSECNRPTTPAAKPGATFFISSSSDNDSHMGDASSLCSPPPQMKHALQLTTASIPAMIVEEEDGSDVEEDTDDEHIHCPLAQRVSHMASSIDLTRSRQPLFMAGDISDFENEEDDDWGSSYSGEASDSEEEDSEMDDSDSDTHSHYGMQPRITLFQKQDPGYHTFVRSQRRSLLSVALQRSALKRSRPSHFRNLSTLSSGSSQPSPLSPTVPRTTAEGAPLDAALDMAVSESLRAHIQTERLAFQQFIHSDMTGRHQLNMRSPLEASCSVGSSSFTFW